MRRALREPFTRRTWRDCLYAGLSLLIAIPLFAFTAVAVTVGLGLSISFAGLPLLAMSLRTAKRLGAVCRRLANRSLAQQAELPTKPLFRRRQERPIEAPPPFRPRPGILGWIRSSLTDQVSWRACAYLLLKLPVALLGGIGLIYVVAWGVGYTTFPLWWELIHQLAAHGEAVQVPGWMAWWKPNPVLVAQSVPSLSWSFALVPAGLFAIVWSPWVVIGSNDLDRMLAARLLGPPMRQRMRELEETRASAVDDSAARLRRIERDLHDGAQAQMVAVAMKLGLAREKLGGAATETVTAAGVSGRTAEIDLARALELVDAAHRSAKEAIVELRDLARGIHPPVLDHGLGTALETLAARSGLPVEVIADLSERPSAAIETIAYFCAAELLANVAKHSGARRATVEAVHVPGLLRLRVIDDGAGGARVAAGGGLAGLAERLRTVDGTMEISSPRGGPSVVTVELPSHA